MFMATFIIDLNISHADINKQKFEFEQMLSVMIL